MKNALLTLILGLFSIPAFSQLDVTINPLGLLFSNIGVSAETPLSENFGLEGTVNYNFNRFDALGDEFKSTGYGLRALGKYYFNSDKGLDKFHAGPYARIGGNKIKYTSGTDDVTSFRFALGIYAGYKWVSKKNIVFELGLGLGRAFVNNYSSNDSSFNAADWPVLNLDATGKLAIGYRF
ncbi:DUF3575 domain-containing protein [Membranihabitans maritimus]|uniref:DUF3575 domain-containing protein n=1 Tax=Membranihabitans maritimus TaxID=2904244 RepID=UPI001F30CFD0|nr:DUF3575 domain-containing protein [Membranihabitans maritimus]